MAVSSIVGATFTVAHQHWANLLLIIILTRGFANMGRGKPCPYEMDKRNTTRCVKCG